MAAQRTCAATGVDAFASVGCLHRRFATLEWAEPFLNGAPFNFGVERGGGIAMLNNLQEMSRAHYGPVGWIHWPDNEEYCLEFTRVLGSAQEGASTISECFLTATRIIPGDDESWYREWKRIGDVNKARGDSAFEVGNTQTAKSNWLRASNYYRSAERFLLPEDNRRPSIVDEIELCSHHYLKSLMPRGEIVQIPYEDGGFLHGYFLRAPESPRQAPVVICFGGLDASKDDQLYKTPRHAFGRGLSLLLVDLPGQGATAKRNKILGRHDQEIPIGYCVDYLLARHDVDKMRIVLYGEGYGGAYASRAASLDDRFAAAVCDGGIWDYNERLFFMNWLSGAGGNSRFSDNAKMPRGFISNEIKCPYLVTLGEHDFIDVSHALELYDYQKEAGAKIDLKIFYAEETGASHCQMDNPTLGREFIFDWITTKLRVFKGDSRLRERSLNQPGRRGRRRQDGMRYEAVLSTGNV